MYRSRSSGPERSVAGGSFVMDGRHSDGFSTAVLTWSWNPPPEQYTEEPPQGSLVPVRHHSPARQGACEVRVEALLAFSSGFSEVLVQE